MSRYFWIIFLLLGLWQIIGSLAERASKKQQDQRVQNLTAQRRRQQQVTSRRAVAETTAGSGATHAVPPADRAGELAARRKAQLDELRRRRTQRTGQPTARAKAAPATLRPTQPSFRPPTAPPTPPAATPRPGPAPTPVARRPAAQPKPRQARPRQAQPDEARRIAPMERLSGDVHRLVPTTKAVEAKGPRSLTLHGLGDVPMDRTLLRRMMLYREILDPPIALREEQVWER